MTGRPSTYRPEYCEQVIKAGMDGYSLTAFGARIGVPRQRLWEWAKVHPEFAEAIEIHKAHRAERWETLLMGVAATGDGNATSCIFALKNVAPDEWRDRQQVEHTGENGGPIKTEDNSGGLVGLARAIAFTLAKAERSKKE